MLSAARVSRLFLGFMQSTRNWSCTSTWAGITHLYFGQILHSLFVDVLTKNLSQLCKLVAYVLPGSVKYFLKKKSYLCLGVLLGSRRAVFPMGVSLGKKGRDDKNYLKILTHSIFPILKSTPWYKVKLTNTNW